MLRGHVQRKRKRHNRTEQHNRSFNSLSTNIIKITSGFLFRSLSFQSKAAAHAPLPKSSGRCLSLAQLLIPHSRNVLSPWHVPWSSTSWHVAGTKFPQNWCYTIIKVPTHTRGRLAATFFAFAKLWFCSWYMFPLHVPALSAYYRHWLSLQSLFVCWPF